MNLPSVQAAIGAYVNFSESSSAVGNAFGSTGDDDREDGTIEAMRSLVKDNVTVVMYTGDADYNCELNNAATPKKYTDSSQATGSAAKQYPKKSTPPASQPPATSTSPPPTTSSTAK